MDESMLEMFLFETGQVLEQLEQAVIASERAGHYSQSVINEIFRFTHTIKGASAMMMFSEVAALSHAMEDLFNYLRDHGDNEDYCSRISDLVLEGVDFIKVELEKARSGKQADGDASDLVKRIHALLAEIKGEGCEAGAADECAEDAKEPVVLGDPGDGTWYKAHLFFEDGCEMEDVRAYLVVRNLSEFAKELRYIPEDLQDNDDCARIIKENGFTVWVRTDKPYGEIKEFFEGTACLKELQLTVEGGKEEKSAPRADRAAGEAKEEKKDTPVKIDGNGAGQASVISVSVEKLDKLMDLVGEMVIAEAMVTQNPEVQGLDLEDFNKAARQLQKITNELQDMVMSIRMVPLSTTFLKMHRVLRDMCRKLNKEAVLELVGENTEVDKNIIEHIGDPLMHLIRNAMDHGIETAEERIKAGKDPVGKITLEAKNSGSDVLILVKDDGRGLDREKILKKARENGLLDKPESELTDRDIYNLILLPGFSTKDTVSEFSGRGVGMDVVVKNLEAIGGSVYVDSVPGQGTVTTLKIPLTLAIIDGMNIKVGKARYTIPIMAIKESFWAQGNDLIVDPDGNEMIMVRGEVYPILRLHRFFNVETEVQDFADGIMVMVEQDNNRLCLFADELLGQQQVVVKALPKYIKMVSKAQGLAGCTLLGDGSISLILDVPGLASALCN